jgi:hypothetical protein
MAKTGGAQVKLPTPSNVSAFNAGDVVVRTKSQSCGYKEKDEYAVYLNEKGWKCLMGRDGYEDPVSLLISRLSKVKRKDQ